MKKAVFSRFALADFKNNKKLQSPPYQGGFRGIKLLGMQEDVCTQ